MQLAAHDAKRLRPTPGRMMVAAAGITLLAFALRLHNLGSDSFWVDELFTIQTALGGLPSLLNEPHHPPLLFALTMLSIEGMGESEFAARLPSMLASVLAIPLLFALSREFKQPGVGLWGALLLAFSPLHLIYAQEARHYALLLTLSLVTFLLLYRALREPRWRWWLGYALVTLANMYTHYGAIIVLAVQGILLFPLLWLQGAKPHRRFWGQSVTALLLVVAGYAPWLSHLLGAIGLNFDPTLNTGTGSAAPTAEWLREAFYAFGMYHGYRPYLLLALSLGGLALWLHRRKWAILTLSIGALLLPVLLIDISNIARGSQVRYIIFALPFYLLAGGAAIDAALDTLWQAAPAVRAGSTVLALAGICFVSWPATRYEYTTMQTDWRSVTSYLEENAAADDVLLLMGTNYASGFNTVSFALPYYLEKSGSSFHTLPAYQLDSSDLQSLPPEAIVWAILYNWQNPTTFAGSTLEAQPFRQWLHVLRSNDNTIAPLEQVTRLYEEIMPLATTPTPQCLLQRDLAAVRLAAEDTAEASTLLTAAEKQCPALPAEFKELQSQTRAELEEQLMEQAIADGNEQEARRRARALLRLNARHGRAQDVLTVVDLLAKFESNTALVRDAEAPEPVSERRFTMPHNGDWGDVLFMHPPASVSYSIELPTQPLILKTRMALDPQSWQWDGDGATFVVAIETETGQTEELLREHIDTKPQERDWHDVALSLERFTGQRITLTLATEMGPAGDGTGDWAGWDQPRLLWAD